MDFWSLLAGPPYPHAPQYSISILLDMMKATIVNSKMMTFDMEFNLNQIQNILFIVSYRKSPIKLVWLVIEIEPNKFKKI